ncbi:MAG: hypothetical protein DRP10_00625 [Candidatus Aenigmatarchaeota archaeon]|nr:MAG: hypothetical protein DRP10_00625 [Candidatus Aenigmarchaeota archaeon]
MVDILKSLDLRLKHGIKKYLIEDFPDVEYIVPREAVVTGNPEELISDLEKNLNIQVESIEFRGIRTKENLSEIYIKYFSEYDSNSLGKYLEDLKYKDAILLVRADCYEMPYKHNVAFAYEIVENPPGELFQKYSREKRLYSLLVFSPKDHTKYLASLRIGTGSVRPITVISDSGNFISMEDIDRINREVKKEKEDEDKI